MKRQVHGRRTAALVVAGAAALAPFLAIPIAGATDGTISGVAFKDTNRDGVKQAGEEALANQYIWLFDAAGTYLRNAQTDVNGAYQLSGVADGTYQVKYWSTGWYDLWMDWTPSTTGGSLQPMKAVQVAGAAVVDFGFRPIVRSTVESSPISTFTAPSRLKVLSYDDVVTAQDVYGALMQGSLFGAEAASTTIHFDWGTGDYCSSSVGQVAGRYGDFTAGCQIDFSKWLTFGDKYLFHEYGHAWGVYHAYLIQQDPALAGYLTARGIKDDSRLGSSHAWSSYEMLAEDYRTLFGSANARMDPQENTEIPAASNVPGLREYLSTTFMTPPAAPPPPPTPAPATSHVGDLDAQSTTGTRNWTGTVTAAVEDGSDQLVAGASVSLSMGSGKQTKTYTCITSSAGRCSVTVTLATKTSSASLSVSGVTKNGLTYTPSANSDPDGDSNGTLIVVNKPA